MTAVVINHVHYRCIGETYSFVRYLNNLVNFFVFLFFTLFLWRFLLHFLFGFLFFLLFVCKMLLTCWRCWFSSKNMCTWLDIADKVVFFLEMRNQILLCDIQLLNWQIGRYMDNLNSVQKRSKHVRDRVARANKDAFAKIKFQVQIAISELVWLFRI